MGQSTREQCPHCRRELIEEDAAAHLQGCPAGPVQPHRQKKRIVVAQKETRPSDHGRAEDGDELQRAMESWVERSVKWYQQDAERKQSEEERRQVNQERLRTERWTWYGLRAISGPSEGLHLVVCLRLDQQQADEHVARIWSQANIPGLPKWTVRDGYEERGIVRSLEAEVCVRIMDGRIGAFCWPNFVRMHIEELDGLELARRETNLMSATR